MEGGIFLLQPDNSLIRMNETAYEAEELLQRLLADHSDLLAGDQIDSEAPRRFFLVYREFGVPDEQDRGNRWSLDHLFLDQDAIPTFVEVKRASDTRARREVVAQMLDYAANATIHWTAGLMRQKHAETCVQRNLDPNDYLMETTGISIEADDFWNLAEQNLTEGRIRMIFVADVIPPPLRLIVEFLNKQMSPAEVVAVEVRQFIGESQGQELKTLVPRVIGQTEAAKEKKSSRTHSGERLAVLETAQFLESLPKFAQEPFREALEIGQAIGFELRPYSSAKSQQIQFTIPGVPSSPVYLYSDGVRHFVLYVSLGRHHLELRDGDVNRRLRDMMATMVSSRRGEIEVKKELGLHAQELTSSALRPILSLIFETLTRSREGENSTQ